MGSPLLVVLLVCLGATSTMAQFGEALEGLGGLGGLVGLAGLSGLGGGLGGLTGGLGGLTSGLGGPLALAALGGEGLEGLFGEGAGGSLLLYQSLAQRVQQLELNVRTGAVGGCESGAIGPLGPGQNTATIQFSGRFLAAPSISLAVSGLTASNIALPVNYQIRPIAVNAQSATIQLIDLTNSVAQATVTYMACPSNQVGQLGQLQG